MNQQFKKWAVMFAISALGSIAVQAQGDGGPLVEALVKKGVLSSQEGEEIRASMLEDNGSTAGGMLSWGSSAVKGVKLYGDARLRYQWENKQRQNVSGTGNGPSRDQDRSRYRYRLRLGADYQFSENWKSGIRLETANASDSTNNNFGGYFDKTGDGVNVGLVYLEYEINNPELFGFSPADYFNLRMGKHLHPFLISNAFWDSDINPEGFSEQVAWKDVGVSGLTFTLRGGQYIISEANENNNFVGNTDSALFVAQTEVNYEWATKTGFSFAPMFMHETGGKISASTQENGGGPDNENADPFLGNFSVVQIPAQVYFNAWGLSHKAFGTWGVNFKGDGLIEQPTNQSADNTPMFFNLGYELAKGKGKGAWKVSAEYRYIEAGSYTTNLSDSDFAKNESNQAGPVIAGNYSFTENISGTVTWMHSNNISPAFNDTFNDAGDTDLIQVDLNWKF